MHAGTPCLIHGDSDWYGYCVDDPVNRVDVWGLEDEEESGASDDPAKESGKRIVSKGVARALWQGLKGYAADGVVGAASRSVLGLGTGMLLRTVAEYPPVKDKIEQAITWFEDNYKPTDDGTMQD